MERVKRANISHCPNLTPTPIVRNNYCPTIGVGVNSHNNRSDL